jgi:hypothetical protein
MKRKGGTQRVDELSVVGWFLKQPHIRAQKTQLQMQIEESGHYMTHHARFWAALFNFIEMMFGRPKLPTREFCTHKMADLKGVAPVSLGMEPGAANREISPALQHNASGYHMPAVCPQSLLRSAPASPASTSTWPKGSCWLECHQEHGPRRSRSLPIWRATGRLSAIKSHPGQRGAYQPAAEGETH